jgi:hypothetical protein
MDEPKKTYHEHSNQGSSNGQSASATVDAIENIQAWRHSMGAPIIIYWSGRR